MSLSAQVEAIELFRHLESRGLKPSIRSLGRMLRELGLHFDDHDLRAWITPFTVVAPQPHRKNQAQTPQPHRKPTAVPRAKSSISPKLTLFTSFREPPEVWNENVDAAFAGIRERKVEYLDPEGRLVLARYHALHYGNFRVDAAKNEREAIRLAASFATLGASRAPFFEGMTCAEYAKHAQRYLELRKGKPFHNPFDIKAAITLTEGVA